MKTKRILHCAAAAGAIAGAIGLKLASSPEAQAEAAPATGKTLSHDGYAGALKARVNARGQVDYKALRADRRQLDLFLAEIGRLSPSAYEGWRKPEKIAFWVNAYNARTLQAIIDHYPIKPSGASRFLYPKNSIRQIPGVWDKQKFRVMGRMMTLNDVEHETLRKQFNEPRIHMALVCASVGCPFLRGEPFTAERLSAQLDEQAKQFVQDPTKFRIDRGAKRVYLSPIFKWFGGDFVKTYAPSKPFAGHKDGVRASLNFQAKHLSASDRVFLEDGKYSVKYLAYDWSLNEQQ